MAGTSICGALRLKIRDALRPATHNGVADSPFSRAMESPSSWEASTLSYISDFRYRFSILRCLCAQ